jgi:L-asparaginase / beta-aspartyl-peptidase
MICTFADRREFLKVVGLASGLLCLPSSAQDRNAKRFAIALHGGAGGAPSGREMEVETSLGKALDIGLAVLKQDGTSLQAVEQVIRFLEDDPLFNAGKGAVFNSAGGHELDSSIMDGRNKACGAVAAVRTVRHPISLARLVMEKTKHVLLTSDGAEKFADEMGTQVERVENAWFDTDRQRRAWERARQPKPDGSKQSRLAPDDIHYGTVGCVALDIHGNLAAGTSTGGITNKKYGRVGDSPIVGAGTYADNATCAISCTGTGEQFIRHAVAHDISARMAYLKQPLKDAVDHVLREVLQPDDGGLIALAADGTIVMDFSTAGMSRAAADSTGMREVKTGR